MGFDPYIYSKAPSSLPPYTGKAQDNIISTHKPSPNMPSDNADVVPKEIERHSKANIDIYMKASTFVSEELHEASNHCHRKCTANNSPSRSTGNPHPHPPGMQELGILEETRR
jgi:hypothetical protein